MAKYEEWTRDGRTHGRAPKIRTTIYADFGKILWFYHAIFTHFIDAKMPHSFGYFDSCHQKFRITHNTTDHHWISLGNIVINGPHFSDFIVHLGALQDHDS